MLRLVELEGGSISVDGIDLSKVSLPDVRGRAVYVACGLSGSCVSSVCGLNPNANADCNHGQHIFYPLCTQMHHSARPGAL